jgi:hypothetical protein
MEEQFQMTPRLKRFLLFLESPTIELASACFVVAGVLRRLFLEPIPPNMRETLAFFILDALATSHPKLEIQRHVRTLIRQQLLSMLSIQIVAIENLLNRW